ncbi:autotransporter outer membrane beta-barrel domain-containing protein [Caballeronia sp. ATUFL_F1_KS4A]|uniref:autotransporter outer membrane beta-barrel domain-containing protein n=1 Tax=Caballeronia sp. ATUFL_F1_KS4A TaxID=2921768 RepID=UPI002028B8B0|nr:autotransporter outer membrane beta-barrel domain-containing protein [Caballeronia sp. ATUFL_F1_KS4A]
MSKSRDGHLKCTLFRTTLKPLSAATLLAFAASSHAGPINSTFDGVTVSDDLTYSVDPDTRVSAVLGDAITVAGQPGATLNNAGMIVTLTGLAAVRYNVRGSLTNAATGQIFGNVSGVVMSGGGAVNNVANSGDISAGIGQAIAYRGATGGSIDNFGTIDSQTAGAGIVKSSSDGVMIDSSAAVIINNHAGATIGSGSGDAVLGRGVAIVSGNVVIVNDGTTEGHRGGVVSASSGTVRIDNSGSGQIIGNLGPGVQLQSGGVLENSGIISSSAQPAVVLAGANNAVTLNGGASLAGANNVAILSQGAGNAVTLNGSGTLDGGLVATPGNGFGQLTASAGSDWTLHGGAALGGSSSSALHVTGNLTLDGALTQEGGGGTLIDSGGTLTLGSVVSGDFVNNGTLSLKPQNSVGLGGALSGVGSLVFAGPGSAVLTGVGSTQGSVQVDAGTLVLGQTGAFNAGTWSTGSGAGTTLSPGATISVGSTFTQSANSQLTVGLDSTQPVVTAANAGLLGTLNVSGFGPNAPHTASALTSTAFTIVQTTGGITGDFTNVGFGGTPNPIDYLTVSGAKTADNLSYTVGFGLTWNAGPQQGNGVFTLGAPSDVFDVDVPLNNRLGVFASGWDGRTLTKSGPGTLIVSAPAGYSGSTLINGGTLRAGVGNAITSSGDVQIARGATFDLNNLPQLVSNLSGAGNVTLGSATLRQNSTADTRFDGQISGTGGLIKLGPGAFTLGGANSYTGDTVIGAGTLVAAASNALGAGNVTNNATLQLDMAGAGALPNVLGGLGALVKTGAGLALLSGTGSSQGSVAVNAGTLAFAQNGAFATTGDFTTAAGAVTLLSSQSQLSVGNNFAMNGTLANVAGGASTAITASTATIAPGASFDLAGFKAPANATPQQLASSVIPEIRTTNGLSGTFDTLKIGGSPSTNVDFATVTAAYGPNSFDVGVGLTWYAAYSTTPEKANGLFTLPDAGDSFNLEAPLADQAANPATNWDGKTLTKAGAGRLTLSQVNTYTGATLVNGGTLQAGAANVIAASSQVALALGTTFDLNGFDQQANSLSGAGNVTLGGATLTANNNTDTTLSGVISGNGNLTKTGANTLTLSGDNTYPGATTIEAGTLRLGAGGASGGVAGNIVDNGTLVFDRSNTYNYGGAISGSGSVVQQGSGSVVLQGVHTYAGTTQVNAGSLVLANGAQLANTPQVNVASGATFGGYGGVGGSVVNNGVLAVADAAPGFTNGPAGQFVIGGSLTNAGQIRMASVTPASTLTVNGNYTGNGGQLALSSALATDDSPTDRLVVKGNTAGQTSVRVSNANGSGGLTNNGIQIVQVDGQSDGVFTLNGRVIAGLNEYTLAKGGVNTPDDGDWYLRTSALLPPEPGAYLGNQAAAQSMFVQTYHDRAGFPDQFSANGAASNDSTAWVRVRGGHTDSNALGGRIDESTDSAMFQAGIDVYRRVVDNQRFQVGLMAGYGSSRTDASAQNNSATARGNVNGASGGVYATWHGNAASAAGPYVDTWLQYAHFNNSIDSQGLPGDTYSSHMWAYSVEGGWALPVANTSIGPVFAEPQLQLVYSNYSQDDHFANGVGTTVHSENGTNLTTRLGVRLFTTPVPEKSRAWLPFVEVNWLHDTGGNAVSLNNVVASQDGPNNRYEIKVGAQGQLGKQWRAWANFGYQGGNGGYHNYEGLVGARYVW